MHLGNPESSRWTSYQCFVLPQYKSPTVAFSYHVFLEETYVFRTLGEFAISLILVISCEPVNVEIENRNFSALEACLQMAIKQS